MTTTKNIPSQGSAAEFFLHFFQYLLIVQDRNLTIKIVDKQTIQFSKAFQKVCVFLPNFEVQYCTEMDLIAVVVVMDPLSVVEIIDTRLSYDGKVVIKKRGRPVPDIGLQKEGSKNGQKFTRKFDRAYYTKFKWLCGCPTAKALFCFPCLIFSAENIIWAKGGFKSIIEQGAHEQLH